MGGFGGETVCRAVHGEEAEPDRFEVLVGDVVEERPDLAVVELAEAVDERGAGGGEADDHLAPVDDVLPTMRELLVHLDDEDLEHVRSGLEALARAATSLGNRTGAGLPAVSDSTPARKDPA